MNTCLPRFLLVALLALLLAPAHAAITCTSITSPGVSINYMNSTTASVQGTFTVSCTRSSAADPLSVNYGVRADNGGNPQGVNNRANHAGGATLRYDLYTGSTCGTQWKGNVEISDTISWPAGSTGTITKQTSYWGCITAAQTAAAAGLYADTVGLTLIYGNNQTVPGSVGVSIYAPALCTMITPAGDLVLPYVAFGAQVVRSTSFSVTCTIGMPYTISTDVPEAVLSGVRYVLGLSATSANGTGAPQSHSITATAPAGQAGACAAGACTATRTHTLTISY